MSDDEYASRITIDAIEEVLDRLIAAVEAEQKQVIKEET